MKTCGWTSALSAGVVAISMKSSTTRTALASAVRRPFPATPGSVSSLTTRRLSRAGAGSGLLLVAVHRAVGRVDELVDAEVAGGGVGHTPGDRRKALAVGHRALFDRIGKPPHRALRDQQRRAGEEDRELVAADTGHKVVVAHTRGQQLPDAHERLVAGGVSELVVATLQP